MRVGCYTLDLYCDHVDQEAFDDGVHIYGEFPHQFTAELGAECRRNARRAGWILKKNGGDICPKCTKKRKTK